VTLNQKRSSTLRRRKTFSETAVTYGSVGCTQAADVMAFPPKGFRPTYDEFRLGSGEARFQTSTSSLMAWGMLAGTGLNIIQLTDADPAGYQGLLFTEFGTPIPPTTAGLETVYSAEGTQDVSAGQSLEVGGVFSPLAATSAFRVVYVIRDDRRVGYAWGTLDEAPVRGEEFFGVEWRLDDSVVAVVRTVTQIAPGRLLRVLTPVIRFRQWMLRRQYVRTLLPARLV
jgi:uncharacterized protein (UPF0548 family)